ncbi:MAG TPA: trigger factor [Desulfosporosinus sp.]|nr:trigger factor [Desulfosporosinus sp.]
MHKVDLGQYKGLEITPLAMFSKEDLEAAVIESLLNIITQWSKDNLPVEEGDEVVVSICATYNSLIVPELCQSDLRYAVGDPKFLTEFKNVIGKKKGEQFLMSIQIPESNLIERIAGKTIDFSATILEVFTSRQIPFTDELAQQLDPSVKNMAALKAKLFKIIETKAQQGIAENNLQAVVNAIIQNAIYELDLDELDKVAQEIHAEALQQNMIVQGTERMNVVLSEGNCDEYLYEDCRILAKQQTHMSLVFEEVARLEDLTISDEELEYEKMLSLEKLQGDTQTFFKLFPTEEVLREGLLKDKIAKHLLLWNLSKIKQA